MPKISGIFQPGFRISFSNITSAGHLRFQNASLENGRSPGEHFTGMRRLFLAIALCFLYLRRQKLRLPARRSFASESPVPTKGEDSELPLMSGTKKIMKILRKWKQRLKLDWKIYWVQPRKRRSWKSHKYYLIKPRSSFLFVIFAYIVLWISLHSSPTFCFYIWSVFWSL